jgi:hypothetical protein
MELIKFPIEILSSCIKYFDCETVIKFWLAACSCPLHALLLWPMLDDLVTKGLVSGNRELDDTSLLDYLAVPSSTETNIRHQTRSLSRRLVMLEYSRKLPNVIWCGRVEFKDPRSPDWSSQHASVVLKAPQCFNANWLQRFRDEFSESIKMSSQLYNFVPIPPFGRLVGITSKDRTTLQDIRKCLEQHDQVMTLRYPSRNLILRVISPEQSSRRLSAFPGARTKFTTFEEGLLCCWEVRCDWEEAIAQETFDAIFHTLFNFQKLKYSSDTISI